MTQWVTRYFVRWKEFGEEEATWERATRLRLHAQEVINEYEYRQSDGYDREEEEMQWGCYTICTHSRRKRGIVTIHSVVVKGTPSSSDR